MIELERPRDAGALLRDSFVIYIRHFWTFLALGALVVVPSELIVSGVGLEQLSSDYDSTPSFAEAAIPAAVSYLVVAPLITAICVYALQSVAAGGSPRAREALVKGFESFTPIFFAVLLAALGILVGAVLILPGVYLFVRWYFVPQAVVLEGAHGADALRASGRLVEGSWWRTLGLIVLVNVAALLVAVVLGAPFTAAANGDDRAIWALIGQIGASAVTQPFGALYSTLLYFDLRQRKRAALG
ncbi:MAG: glycerophosphoryl diester phosphodiesterase membrane domain-containing protein [Thermoleophilaceae bacterium]|nr:glycerophosphoryl diester phosphodiesterase membrane domain-containing protein [Thermoleophilaceae bacterium]